MFKSTPVLRLFVYGLALLAMATSFFMTAVESPLAPAFVQTANLLGAAAGVGAISNLGTLSRRPGDVGIVPDEPAAEGFGAADGAGAILEAPLGRFAERGASEGVAATATDAEAPRHARRTRPPE
ncbi:hypothetical protein [Leucobacter iarius]|uniref:Uncharacterized protein n=1 Tax=Leucobacter iarius TaxID=333963 RepID=A0ABN2L6C3_9MICO